MSAIFRKIKPSALICLILVLAAFIRSYMLFHGMGFHPDERGIQMIISNLTWSKLNAQNFHYGSFAYYLCWFSGQIVSLFTQKLSNYDLCFIIGRVYAVIFGVAAVYISYVLVRFVTKDFYTAALTAFLLATNVFHLQLSRFYTVDILLTTISIATLYACCRLYYDKRWNNFYGVLLGLAFANKISALTLLVPYFMALLLKASSGNLKYGLKIIIKNSLQAALLFVLTVLVVEPFLFLDFEKFIQDNNTQVTMVKGLWVPPYTIQYIGTIPYLYHLKQMFHYTVSPPVALLAVLGMFLVLYKSIRSFNPGYLIILSWFFAVFVSIAGYQVKFPRYLLSIYPIIMFLAAYPLGQILNQKFKTPLTICLVCICLLKSIAWLNIYRYPHVYKISSEWIYENIPKGSTLAHMHWDDRLPLDGKDYSHIEIGIYDNDSEVNLGKILASLSKADYLMLPTAKMINAIPRDTERFPVFSKLVKALVTEKLGYKLMQKFKIKALFHPDDSLADESLSIYDHPMVRIYKNDLRLDPNKLVEILKEDRANKTRGLREFSGHNQLIIK